MTRAQKPKSDSFTCVKEEGDNGREGEGGKEKGERRGEGDERGKKTIIYHNT